MAKSKRKRDPIPEQFNSFDELANFWETHDLTDYEDQMVEVNYEIARKPTRQFVVTLSDELTKPLRKVTHREGVSMQTLVNSAPNITSKLLTPFISPPLSQVLAMSFSPTTIVLTVALKSKLKFWNDRRTQ